jgi:hypothetical protein
VNKRISVKNVKNTLRAKAKLYCVKYARVYRKIVLSYFNFSNSVEIGGIDEYK